MADGVKISDMPNASSPSGADVLAGVQNNRNKKFSLTTLLQWIKDNLSLTAADVGAVDTADVGVADGVASLDSTGKVPSSQLPTIPSDASDITYDPTTSGLTAANVQDAIDEVQGEIGNLPSPPAPSDANPQDLGTAAAGSSTDYSRADHVHNKPSAADIGAQSAITASGILKGDGAGGVSAATAGTDYGTYSKPSGGIPASDLASGVIPAAYTSNPAMDGTASPGSSGAWARGDHVHPSDTTKANQSQLATVVTGSTASRNYSVGEYFCLNGLLYRVTSAISSGQSFTPGTNCGQVTVGAELQKVVFNKQTTNGTFYDVAPGWAARALDNVVSNISNYQSGVYNVSSSGGPDFIVVLGKYSNSYYSGLIFNYNSSFFGLFQYFNGQRTLKQLAQI